MVSLNCVMKHYKAKGLELYVRLLADDHKEILCKTIDENMYDLSTKIMDIDKELISIKKEISDITEFNKGKKPEEQKNLPCSNEKYHMFRIEKLQHEIDELATIKKIIKNN